MLLMIDTGVWLRAFDKSSSERPAIVQSLQRAFAENDEIVTTTQNIAEFWNVSTRPHSARGGFGLTSSVVNLRVQWIERIARVLPFTLSDYQAWRELVMRHQITGVSVHDARLVAVMQTNGIGRILTLNTADFRRYAGIAAMTPSEYLLMRPVR